MGRKKLDHGRVMTPEAAASAGLIGPAGLSAAADITRQLREAQDRAAASAARRAVSPPPANRGGKSSGAQDGGFIKLVLDDGKVKEVPKRRGYGGDSAMIDWLNMTIGVETFDAEDCTISPDNCLHEDDKRAPLSPDDYAVAISRKLKAILGYGISHKLGYGQYFYDSSWALAEGWGTVSIGGQRDTVLVSISGTGLAAAREGWESRLQAFLSGALRSRITRVDLAHDDYEGSRYTVDKADRDHTGGLFNNGGRNPRCEYRGDWKNPDGKGRSFYVGNRKNGKYCRVYEKGRELGCSASPWVRVEVEIKSDNMVIPFDILTRPGEYLAASYPAFAWVNERQERIETTKRVVSANVQRALKTVRHQFGSYIHHLVEIFGKDEFLSKVMRSDKIPAFAKVPHHALAEKPIHEKRVFNPTPDQYAAVIAW